LPDGPYQPDARPKGEPDESGTGQEKFCNHERDCWLASKTSPCGKGFDPSKQRKEINRKGKECSVKGPQHLGQAGRRKRGHQGSPGERRKGGGGETITLARGNIMQLTLNDCFGTEKGGKPRQTLTMKIFLTCGYRTHPPVKPLPKKIKGGSRLPAQRERVSSGRQESLLWGGHGCSEKQKQQKREMNILKENKTE